MKTPFRCLNTLSLRHRAASPYVFAFLCAISTFVAMSAALCAQTSAAASSVASTSASAAVPTASTTNPVLPLINVLIVPFDGIDGETAAARAVDVSADAKKEEAAGNTARSFKPPGAAQAAAAALRRSLVRLGWSDVLTADPESAVIRRALNEHRLTAAELEALSGALSQMATQSLQSVATPDSVALNNAPLNTGVPTNAPPITPAAITPVETAKTAPQDILRMTTRIGQALNYRAVLALAVVPRAVVPRAASAGDTTRREATYVLYMADVLRENGAPFSFDGNGVDASSMHEAAALAAAAFADKELKTWAAVGESGRTQKVQEYLQTARLALQNKRFDEARVAAQQVLSLDASQTEALLLLGDALKISAPADAAATYRRALGRDAANDGLVWTRIAAAQAAARNWPEVLDAARQATALNYDSAALRQALAAAQFGRAQLFREAGRMEDADTAEASARDHIARARALAPDDPETVRVLASYLVQERQVREAVQALDGIAPRYPNDLEVQTLYARALTERGNRDADAFAAWSRVWKMQVNESPSMLSTRDFRRISEGFDEYASKLAKEAAQLTAGLSSGAVPREEALLRIQRINADMERAAQAIKRVRPANSAAEAAHAHRIFAADLLEQALDQQTVYVETGDEMYRNRAADLHRQAILQLNAARGQ